MENQTNQFTPNKFMKTLSIIHLGLISWPTIVAVIVYLNTQSASFNFADTDNMFLVVVPIFALSSVFLGDFIFKQSIKNIPRTSSLKQKLTRFQTASIIKYGLIEAAAFFGVIGYYMTNNLAFLMISVILILYFFMLRPTKEKIMRVLNLKGSDRDQFNRPNQPLE